MKFSELCFIDSGLLYQVENPTIILKIKEKYP